MSYQVTCKYCNQSILDSVKYCPFCGKCLIQLDTENTKKEPYYFDDTANSIEIKQKNVITQEDIAPHDQEDIIKENDIEKKEQTSNEISQDTPTPNYDMLGVYQKLDKEKVEKTVQKINKNDEVKYKRIIVLSLCFIFIFIGGYYIYKNTLGAHNYDVTNQKNGDNAIQDISKKENEIEIQKVRADAARAKADAEIAKAKADAEVAKANAEAEIAIVKAEVDLAKANADGEVSKSKIETKNNNIKSGVDKQEIASYVQQGINYYESGKYELSIEKMKEVLKRDRGNNRALQYISMAQNRLNEIDQEFRNPIVGGSR
jgi:hypothetical protein